MTQTLLWLLQLDNNVTSMFCRLQVVKRRKRVLKREDLFVYDRLQVDLVLCKEITQVLLLLSRSDTNSPWMI